MSLLVWLFLFQQFDTVEEVADYMKVDPSKLKETLDEYNEYARSSEVKVTVFQVLKEEAHIQFRNFSASLCCEFQISPAFCSVREVETVLSVRNG